MPEIIFDNCVVGNFALSDALSILKGLYANTAYITDFVAAESLKGVSLGYNKLAGIREAVKEGWLREIPLRAPEEKALFETLAVSLGFGEASGIAAAKTRNYIFACDDKAARREAGLLGVRLTGTLGILVKAIREKILDREDADTFLKSMVAQGFYSPVRSLKEIG